MPKIVSVIMNAASGAGDAGQLRGDLEAAFAREGLRAHILNLPRPPSAVAVEQLVSRAEGTLVVAGGDGTINAVASACRRLRRPFGIVPAGTFNYVARNLGIPTEIAGAARTIAHGVPVPVAAGEINGELFLNNAGFGLYSHLIEQRELDKRRFGRRRVIAFLSALHVLSERYPLHEIRVEADGREHTLRTTTLFFGVNALQLRNYNVEAAACVERGRLAVLSLRLDSRWDIAKAALAALRGKTEAADVVGATCASSVRIATRRRKLKVALDGEIKVLRPPLLVKYLPDALQVYVDPEQAERARGADASSVDADVPSGPAALDPTLPEGSAQPN